ncbi:metal ABC transporter ATP-binding protein [Aeromicrobium sp. CF3.5]|uniref:metal ABC transporter ATP-binding protein n=1 Tax=Aeromicrobium sp. CF3.5 TaxID=3373078 RepID=UPI003EE4A83A
MSTDFVSTGPLVAQDVHVSLDGRSVLHGVDLRVGPGELVVLLGANGSGKSTLVRAAVGLVPMTSGRIELFGTVLDQFKDRSRLGYVPQRMHASGGVPATVHEVVLSGRLAQRRLFARRSAADLAAVETALDRVDLADRALSSVNALSGGQQQRVLIARALAGGADLLVMDEPTAGVDHSHQETLSDLMGTLLTEGTSVLLVAHELGAMRPLIHRAVVLDQGRVVHDGPVEEIDHPGGNHESHTHLHTGAPVRESIQGEGVWP